MLCGDVPCLPAWKELCLCLYFCTNTQNAAMTFWQYCALSKVTTLPLLLLTEPEILRGAVSTEEQPHVVNRVCAGEVL